MADEKKTTDIRERLKQRKAEREKSSVEPEKKEGGIKKVTPISTAVGSHQALIEEIRKTAGAFSQQELEEIIEVLQKEYADKYLDEAQAIDILFNMVVPQAMGKLDAETKRQVQQNLLKL